MPLTLDSRTSNGLMKTAGAATCDLKSPHINAGRGLLIGYTGIVQATFGLQLGDNVFVELIVFEDQEALERFEQGRWQLAANASVVVVTAGAAASADYEEGVTVFVWSKGGLLLEAALGAQKFIFRPAVLGRGFRSTPSTMSTAASGHTP